MGRADAYGGGNRRAATIRAARRRAKALEERQIGRERCSNLERVGVVAVRQPQPYRERDGHTVAFDELAEIIPDGLARAEIMVGGELSIKGCRLGGRGEADSQGG